MDWDVVSCCLHDFRELVQRSRGTIVLSRELAGVMETRPRSIHPSIHPAQKEALQSLHPSFPSSLKLRSVLRLSCSQCIHLLPKLILAQWYPIHSDSSFYLNNTNPRPTLLLSLVVDSVHLHVAK